MTMRRVLLAHLVALSAVLSGCAPNSGPSVYVRSPTLAETWKGAGPALAEAEYLKVYDEQLKRFSAQADQQDLAVARNGAAARDSVLMEVMSADRPTGEARLAQEIGDELELLLGAAPSDADLVALSAIDEVVSGRQRAIATYEDLAVDERREFERLRTKAAGAPPPDTTCAKLADPAHETRLRASAGAGERALRSLAATCRRVVDLQKTQQDTIAAYVDAGGLKAAFDATRTAQSAVTPAEVEALSRELSDALRAAGDAGARRQGDLAAFRVRIDRALRGGLGLTDEAGDALSTVNPAGKEVSLEHLAGEIDAILRANVCSAGRSAEPELLTAARCQEVEAGGTTAKAQAAWRFLEALALLSDAAHPDTRSAHWMAGAKAIVAAAQSDVRLQTELARAVSRLRQDRFRARLYQASALANAALALQGRAERCPRGIGCAVVYYAEAMDRGAIPAEILEWREIYLDREYGVRRERVAADRERQLILSAAAQMQAYLNGGVDPATIARALQTAGFTLLALP